MLVVRQHREDRGHGGVQRSNQLFEIVEESRNAVVELDFEVASRHHSKILNQLCSLLSSSFYGKFDRLDWKLSNLRRLNREFCALRDYLASNFRGDAIWIEAAHWHRLLIDAAKSAGLRVILTPQNVESFVPLVKGQRTRSGCIHEIDEETHYLSKADHIFTICEEDSSILEWFGIQSEVLPYAPPAIHAAFLSDVRELRRSAEKDIFLVIGTTHNPPTRRGLETLMRSVSELHLPAPLHVCGYGTEELKSFSKNPLVVLEGGVTSERLQSLMVRARALLVNQVSTTGCLTRIADFLSAGVPVIANTFAARGYYGNRYVNIFRDVNELIDCLVNCDTEVATLPSVQRSQVQRFRDVLSAPCLDHIAESGK